MITGEQALRILRQELTGDKFKRITKSEAHFRNWVYIVTGCEKRYKQTVMPKIDLKELGEE